MGTSFQLFNLETMSGVFPGTRTMVFQRVRVRPLDQDDATPAAAQWVRLLWYEEPPACAVELGANLLRIAEPLNGDFGARLAEALAASGLQYMACGSCAFWQPAAAKTADGLPAGRCTWSAVVPGAQASSPAPPWQISCGGGGSRRGRLRSGRVGGAVAAGVGLQPLGTGWERAGCTIRRRQNKHH